MGTVNVAIQIIQPKINVVLNVKDQIIHVDIMTGGFNYERVFNETDSRYVAKLEGYGLSQEDYTTEEKERLAGIESGAQVNTVNTVNGQTGNVTLDKKDINLSEVDNTSDLNKPISTLTQAELDNKSDITHNHDLSYVNKTLFASHVSNIDNPHGVTKSQVGLENVVNADTTTTSNITDSLDKRFVTDAQKNVLQNTSGTNTGDQDLSGLVAITTTVNSKALSNDIVLDKSDVGLGNVDNISDVDKPISTLTQAALDLKENSFTKNTAFNKNFGTTTGTVAEGDHVHTSLGALTVNGNLTVDGNISIIGGEYETHAEQLYTTKDIIITRDGAVGSLADGSYTGLQAKLYDGTNDGQLVYDNTGTARVGDVGSLQALATREDNPTNKYVAVWNDTLKRFDTTNTLSIYKVQTSLGIFTNNFVNVGKSNVLYNVYSDIADTYFNISNENGTYNTALKINGVEIVNRDSVVNASVIEDKFLRNDADDTISGKLTAAGLIDNSLTTSRLLASDSNKQLVSVSLNDWVAGTINQITVTDDADGGIALSLPQDIATGSTVRFGKVGIGIAPTEALQVSGNAVFGSQVVEGNGKAILPWGNWNTITHNTFNGNIGSAFPYPECGVFLTNVSSARILPWGYYMGVVKELADGNPTSIRLDLGFTQNINSVASGGTGPNGTFTPIISLRNHNGGQVYMYNVYSTTVSATNRDLYIDSYGKLGYVSSSIRYKENVIDMEDVSWLYKLRPVNFNYKNDDDKLYQYGLIAEEVEQINKDFVFYNKDNQVEGVQYKQFIAVLIKEIQNLKKEINNLQGGKQYEN